MDPELSEKLSFLGALREHPGAQVVSLSAVTYLKRLDADGTEAVLQLFDELKPGTNYQKEILFLLEEIALKDSIPAGKVIEDIMSDIPDATHPRARRIEAARDALLRRRYPRLAACEEKFARITSEIDCGTNVKWQHEPSFEDGRVTVTFSFENKKELENVLERLKEAADNGSVDELVRVCNCEVKVSGKTADI